LSFGPEADWKGVRQPPVGPYFNFAYFEFRPRRAKEVAMPDWHILDEAVVGESNPSLFERLVFEPEDAIWRRLWELSKNPDGPLEL